MVSFCGNIGSDAVVSNESLRFSVAVSGAGKDAPSTWVTVFSSHLALAEWLKKGASVSVTGRLNVDQTSGRVTMYNEQPNLSVQAGHVQIVKFASPAVVSPTTAEEDDDIPF